MQNKTELTLEQTQQGVSDEVLNIRVMLKSIHNDDGNPSRATLNKLCWKPHKDASAIRTASAAAKPCQGDSLKFYLFTGIIYTD
ncbi:hypothetical protein Tco_0590686 [Tanacetum coccineum]